MSFLFWDGDCRDSSPDARDLGLVPQDEGLTRVVTSPGYSQRPSEQDSWVIQSTLANLPYEYDRLGSSERAPAFCRV